MNGVEEIILADKYIPDILLLFTKESTDEFANFFAIHLRDKSVIWQNVLKGGTSLLLETPANPVNEKGEIEW